MTSLHQNISRVISLSALHVVAASVNVYRLLKMNPTALGCFTPRRRKLEPDEICSVYDEPHPKAQKILINEKELDNEMDMECGVVDAQPAPLVTDMRMTTTLHNQSLPLPAKQHTPPMDMTASHHTEIAWSQHQHVPDHSVSSGADVYKSTIPNSCFMFAGQGHVTEPPRSCQLCLSGDSGHIHHILSRVQGVRKQ